MLTKEYKFRINAEVDQQLRYFWWISRASWLCIDSKATDMFKAQKGSKDFVKIVLWYSRERMAKTDTEEKKLLNKIVFS